MWAILSTVGRRRKGKSMRTEQEIKDRIKALDTKIKQLHGMLIFDDYLTEGDIRINRDMLSMIDKEKARLEVLEWVLNEGK